uniref:Cytochrome c oxidase subunit 5A, mitochondrial n=1 Tax=Pseudodiaptomus poplesia TaxID=213370 RepID=A0A0U2KDC5_9MAXI|nr:cytochrome c oxidase subunit Va protein-like protein [Pseudodiaptomus poplesia]
MFRALVVRGATTFQAVSKSGLRTSSRFMSADKGVSEEEFDKRYEAYFNRPDIDGWEIRKGMSDLFGMDLVPEPVIVAAALRACRRVNDYSLTTRILESVKVKCGNKRLALSFLS